MELTLIITASILTIAAYYVYYTDHKFSSIEPSRFSWIIWSLAMVIETLTYSFVSGDLLKSGYFIISSLACILLTIRILMHSKWIKPTVLDLVCLAFSLFALFAWAIFQSPWIGHVISLIAIPIGFIPTFSNAFTHYRREASKAWVLWAISDLLIIILILLRLESIQELPYAIVEFISHVIILAILAFGYFRPVKKILEIRENTLGKGVYSKIGFEKGEVIIKFKGKLHSFEEVREKLGGPEDHYLQIDENNFLGPSGEADDFINHSCNPNSGLIFRNNRVYLIAIQTILPGTEITFDYSTSELEAENKMECRCQEPNCRGVIAGFEELDHFTQTKYLELGVVAPYIYVNYIQERKKSGIQLNYPFGNLTKSLGTREIGMISEPIIH